MKKGRKGLRVFTTLLFILLFLWTSLLPTPVLAAEAVGEWVAEQSFNESSLGDSFLGLLASGKKKQQKREEAMEDQILPRNERAPVGRKQATSKIKRELTGKRNANAKFYELSDGRIRAEVSSGPIHYKDSKGKWQDIDPSITATETEPGFSLGNKKNTFHTYFGKKPEQLVKFKLGNHHLTLGVEGAKGKTVAPKVDRFILRFSRRQTFVIP